MNHCALSNALRGALVAALILVAGAAWAQPARRRPTVLRTAAELPAAPIAELDPPGSDEPGRPHSAASIVRADADDVPVTTAPPPPAGVRRFPAADPRPAEWGNVDHPRESAAFAPPTNYLLVRPAQGVVQPEWGHPFEQTVTNPDETYHHGPVFCCPVELERPDGLAPIGVFGDHTLKSGEVLLSYRFNNTIFSGLRDGTDDVSTGSVLNDYPFAPTRLQAQRHTLLLEYAPTDDLTLLALLPFWDFGMDFTSRTGQHLFDSNTDPGDVIVEALYVVWRGERQQIHLNVGLQIPVGVEEWDRDPPTADSPNETYPMRNSSGTYDFMPGATYRGQNDWWTWGAQATGVIRFGINNFDYKLGDRVNLTAWVARRLSDYLSLSFRLDGNIWGDLFGADPRLNPFLTPTNNPSLQGGGRLDALFGMNLFVPGDYIPAQWFSVEGGIPAYQSLVGPQLKTGWTLTAGYNVRF
ncbi:MAG: hypothetical protein ACT4QC_16555 [Planctomycetaceae bacterium]